MIFQEVLKENNSSMLFSATYKFRYCANISSDQAPLGSYNNTLLDIPSSDIAPCNGLSSLPDTRYPLHHTTTWNRPLPNPGRNTLTQGYVSPGSDSSSLCLPADLSNYVRDASRPHHDAPQHIPKYYSRALAMWLD
jgi:hypothetical protein